MESARFSTELTPIFQSTRRPIFINITMKIENVARLNCVTSIEIRGRLNLVEKVVTKTSLTLPHNQLSLTHIAGNLSNLIHELNTWVCKKIFSSSPLVTWYCGGDIHGTFLRLFSIPLEAIVRSAKSASPPPCHCQLMESLAHFVL